LLRNMLGHRNPRFDGAGERRRTRWPDTF